MPVTQPTPRDEIRVPLGLAWALLGRPLAELDGLLDEYDAARRDQVLTEAADLIQARRVSVHATRAGLDYARDLLLAARTTTAQEQ